MPYRLPVAVIDTTLLSRLVDTGLAVHLSWAFSKIHIPSDVAAEIGRRPGKARRKLRNLFKTEKGFYIDCLTEDPLVREMLNVDLDPGEASVIAQADQLKAVAIIDERKGFERAKLMAVEVQRTGFILCRPKEAGAIENVGEYLMRLRALGFTLTQAAHREILQKAGEV